MGSGKTSFIGKRTEWVILLKIFWSKEGEIFILLFSFLARSYLKMKFLVSYLILVGSLQSSLYFNEF